MSARIVIISGAAGTGKTSLSKILAENSTYDCAVRIQIDEFNDYIRKGFISPWLNGARNQNETVIEAVAESAKRFSKGGYEVFIDGVVTPKLLASWIEMAAEGFDVRYIVLRPNEQTTVTRAAEREQNILYPLETEFVLKIWSFFSDLGQYESHVIDTSAHILDESVALIQKKLVENTFLIV